MAMCRRGCSVVLNVVKSLQFKTYLANVRQYSIRPPECFGGRTGIRDNNQDLRIQFPEHSETFEERLAKLAKENGETKAISVNIGVDYKPKVHDRHEFSRIALANHRNKDLEQAARFRTLKVPLDEVQNDWLQESGPRQYRNIAEHYGIYRDLFNNAFFMPVVFLKIFFDCDDDHVLPVCRGNKLLPSMAKAEPIVEYESADDTLWTLVLTNPDGHLSDQTSEYVHWMVGNIHGSDISSGEVLVKYLQPIPPKGTGYHRYVFVLFEQSQKIDYTKMQRDVSENLDERTFKMADFYREHEDLLVPKGLAFFQSQWDQSVRNIYHSVLNMGEPVYEYAHRPPYHPPPLKYPHKQPFDRYFDRYRDKKDLAEEVMRMKLQMISPFRENQVQNNYPLIHRSKTYKPSWLKRREEIMHRRLEQYKDLP